MFIDLRERGRKRNINWLPPVNALTGNQTLNLGMCPDLGSNLQPFGEQNDGPIS